MVSRFIAFCMAVTLHSAMHPALAQPASSPEQIVRNFMQDFYSDNSNGDFRRPATARKYFTPASAKIIIAQSKNHIDADFIVDGQDFQIKNLQFATASEVGARAKVTVRLENFGKKVVNYFNLVEMSGKWLIQDVCKPDKSCLLQE